MFFLLENPESGQNWQSAYQQLAILFQQLALDYQASFQLHSHLLAKIELIASQNAAIRAHKISKSFQIHPIALIQPILLQQPVQTQITSNSKKKRLKKKKGRRSSQSDSSHEAQIFACPYNECNGSYSSSISLNLHIKTKHGGGSKKQRQAYAKALLDAEERGLEVDSVKFNLPPKFLDEYRSANIYKQKYCS